MTNNATHQETPRCPICGHPLEVSPAKRKGWLIPYPVATCPHCGAQMEIKEHNGGTIKAVRFLLIPEETASFWPRKGWEALKGFIPYNTAQQLGSLAYQRAKKHREITRHLIEDEPPLCTSPLALKKNEVCLYAEEHGRLAEQRVSKEGERWILQEEGPLVITTRSIYVGGKRIMLNKIEACTPTAEGIIIQRHDRKRLQRIQAENRYAVQLALRRALGEVCPQPTIEKRGDFQQSPSFAAKVSIPLPKAKRLILPPFLAFLLACVLLAGSLFGGSKVLQVLTPTPTPTPTITPTPTSTPTPTATSTPRYTPTPKPTATRMPTRTPTPTPTITPTPTNTPQPTATPTPRTVATPVPPPPPPPPTPKPAPSCIVETWVDNPNPPQNSTVTVFGKLTCDGVGIANAPMHTVWHYKSSTPTCDSTTGGDGVATCQRRIGRATVGYFVRIDVAITWNGQTYYASTGFTPQ